MQKYTLLLFLMILGNNFLYGQKESNRQFEVINLFDTQLRLMNKYVNAPADQRNQALLDSVFFPHQELWKGYLGNDSSFIDWLNETAFPNLSNYNQKAANIDLNKLTQDFEVTVDEMITFTGHQPVGKWYLFFGPAWVNLGGLNDGIMLIDLAHHANSDYDQIVSWLAHEINHQIYSNTSIPTNFKALKRVLDEGFACYVSYLYHNQNNSIAEELNYSDDDYQFCQTHEKELFTLLKKYYSSDEEKVARAFADRNFKFSPDYPGAIGYYIGFRVVEEFVKNQGPDSWKKIYVMNPEEVLELSGVLK